MIVGVRGGSIYRARILVKSLALLSVGSLVPKDTGRG